MSVKPDQWVIDHSPIEFERLHALGYITFSWNQCEKSLFWLFSTIISLPEEQCWALVHDMGDVSVYPTIAALMKLKKYHAESVAAIDNVLQAYDICRENRNQLTHFEVSGSADSFALMRKSKKRDTMAAANFPADLTDLREVATQIDRVDDYLWILTVVLGDYDPTKPGAPWPQKLQSPRSIVRPPQTPPEQKHQQKPSRASRKATRKALVAKLRPSKSP
jgi:hypothetical protein